jgi:hypothetical protein
MVDVSAMLPSSDANDVDCLDAGASRPRASSFLSDAWVTEDF